MVLKEIDRPEVSAELTLDKIDAKLTLDKIDVELTWDKIDAELAELGLMPETEADVDKLVEELVQLFKIIEDGHYVFGEIGQAKSADYHESLEVEPTAATLRLGIQNLTKRTDMIDYRNHVGRRPTYRLRINNPTPDIDLGFSFDLKYDIKDVWIGGSGRFGQASVIDFKWLAHSFDATRLIQNSSALRILVCSQQALKAVEAVAETTQ